MTTTELLRAEPTASRTWVRRTGAASGLAFVVLTFAGNSLTESVIEPSADPNGPQALEDFAVKAASTAAQIGLAMELLGFVALAVFVGFTLDTLRRKNALGQAGIMAAVSATIMLAVKLASGAPHLAGLAYHSQLSPDTALALTLTNGAAFVVAWLPFAVFVLAAAWALHTAGVLGRFGTWSGLVIGGLGILAALSGAADTASAMPVPFLLGCLWTAVISLKIAVVSQN